MYFLAQSCHAICTRQIFSQFSQRQTQNIFPLIEIAVVKSHVFPTLLITTIICRASLVYLISFKSIIALVQLRRISRKYMIYMRSSGFCICINSARAFISKMGKKRLVCFSRFAPGTFTDFPQLN